MIQGNVSAHASFQTHVLPAFYLQQLPQGGFNLLTPVLLQMGRQQGCATTRGWGQGTSLSCHCRSRCQRGVKLWAPHFLGEAPCSRVQWAVKRVQEAIRHISGMKVCAGQGSGPSLVLPTSQVCTPRVSQFACLKCGCFYESLISASFCLKTWDSNPGENNLIDFLVPANPELPYDLLTTTGLLFLISAIVLRGFCLLLSNPLSFHLFL